jgi:MoaA/NifB/PqqE/SkfB family radical SAM enzyme
MKWRSVLQLAGIGLSTVLWNKDRPVVGSIILTDRCNLSCKHCAVNNLTGLIYSYPQVKADLLSLFTSGVRILFFYGGEPFLWTDQGETLQGLVAEAHQMGFLLVNVVTNGTFPLDVPAADLIMVSLDGSRASHNEIRGDTYDLILANIQQAKQNNICLYMAINQINQKDIEAVAETARNIPQVKAVSFNFHTPYPGTESLSLSRAEKQACCNRISQLIDRGYPILNLRSAFPAIVANSFETPCRQCLVMENGETWQCGRCQDIPELCQDCGYFFAAEFSLLFSGKISVIVDLLKTYLKYL